MRTSLTAIFSVQLQKQPDKKLLNFSNILLPLSGSFFPRLSLLPLLTNTLPGSLWQCYSCYSVSCLLWNNITKQFHQSQNLAIPDNATIIFTVDMHSYKIKHEFYSSKTVI